MATVKVSGVDVAFGDHRVLDAVDLRVADASTMALLGPSGSGKSTLLRIIAGLVAPDSGTVRLDGVDVAGTPPHRRGVGVVFQGQALFPHMDVDTNVGFGLRMAGVNGRERDRRVAQALDLVGLPQHGSRDPATLSGGEAQRVAIARALAPRPGVLLLDEPLAALDQLLRERLLLELRQLFDELDVTVIAVTHDPTEAAALGDRIAVLLDGRIAQEDEAVNVLARPTSSQVAGLVGQRNVIGASVAEGIISCAWGRFPLEDLLVPHAREMDLLVPPTAISPDPQGALQGIVTGLIYRGGSAFAVVAAPEEWPPLDMAAPVGWRVGDHVRVSVDPQQIHLMSRS